ncbi:hypothetical protein Tco_1211548 [Tanacetum coccineum]
MTEQGTKKRKGGHIKMLARKRKISQSDVDSDDGHRKCLKIVTFEGTTDSEIMDRKSVISKVNKVLQRIIVGFEDRMDGLLVLGSQLTFQDQTVLGKDYSNLLIADSLLKTIWFIYAPCYGNGALASPKANDQTATGKGKSNPFMAAKDVDEDGKCLKIRSRCVKVFGYILQELKKHDLKKHEVKQVQQSCLKEDCWELNIPDLVPIVIVSTDSTKC